MMLSGALVAAQVGGLQSKGLSRCLTNQTEATKPTFHLTKATRLTMTLSSLFAPIAALSEVCQQMLICLPSPAASSVAQSCTLPLPTQPLSLSALLTPRTGLMLGGVKLTLQRPHQPRWWHLSYWTAKSSRLRDYFFRVRQFVPVAVTKKKSNERRFFRHFAWRADFQWLGRAADSFLCRKRNFVLNDAEQKRSSVVRQWLAVIAQRNVRQF